MKISNLLALTLVFILLISFQATAKNLLPNDKIIFVDNAKKGVSYLCKIDPKRPENIEKLTPAMHYIAGTRINKQRNIVGFNNKTKDMTSEAYLLDLKTKKVSKILANASLLCFSPDGNNFVYSSSGKNSGLFIYNLTDKTSKKIYSNKLIVSASISADNNWLAASYISKGGYTDLLLMSLLNFKVKKITDTPRINEFYPQFIENNKLIFTHGENRRNYIAFFDMTKLISKRTNLRGKFPSVSQNGNWILYQMKNDIYVIRKNGRNKTKITEGFMPIWQN